MRSDLSLSCDSFKLVLSYVVLKCSHLYMWLSSQLVWELREHRLWLRGSKFLGKSLVLFPYLLHKAFLTVWKSGWFLLPLNPQNRVYASFIRGPLCFGVQLIVFVLLPPTPTAFIIQLLITGNKSCFFLCSEWCLALSVCSANLAEVGWGVMTE